MYTSWFKLSSLPFRLRPDPEFAYLSGTTEHILSDLRLAVRNSRGTILLIGEAGLGKTTILQVIERDCIGRFALACLYQPDLTTPELLGALAMQFGLRDAPGESNAAVRQINHFLAAEATEGRKAIILVDNAHRMSMSTLRDLLSLGTTSTAPLIIIAGTPRLQRNVREAAATQSGQVVRLAPLERLDKRETTDYILHRMRIAGCTDESIFEPAGLDEVLRHAGGVPKLINLLCDRALVLAEARGSRRVSASDMRNAALALEMSEFQPEAETQVAEPVNSLPWHSDISSLPVDATAGRQLKLVVTFRGESVTQKLLVPGRFIVGRGEDADLRLHSHFISRHHCLVITSGEHSIIEDLGSTNGLLINGRRMRVHRLAISDRIRIGEHDITCVAADTRDG